MAWTDLGALAELEASGKMVARTGGRQVLILKTEAGLFACPNRCPHEGYPLSEGVLTDGCVLTCNWHNWKFDLDSGETLVGGDRLTLYPVRVEDGRVLADLTPPDPAARRDEVLANVEAALERFDQQRLVRETARLVRLGADPVDAVRTAIAWAPERFEFGATHAIAGAPDWLALYDGATPGSAERLVAIGEILGHIAEDATLARQLFPYEPGLESWDAASFLSAIEQEREADAVALVRSALGKGIGTEALAPVLVEAALGHYADFGHSLIYTTQTLRLAERLGADSALPLLLMLIRSLVYATREDLLPEFRDYHRRLAAWGDETGTVQPFDPRSLVRASPKSAMATVASWGSKHGPEEIFAVLVEAAALILLRVRDDWLTRPDASLADNVGWLDFTHALTFADASRRAAAIRPDLWPAVLLQLACFIGRNAGYADPEFDLSGWRVDDPRSFFREATAKLFDHGRDRFIISVHLLKTVRAGDALAEALPAQAPTIATALNRFLNSPMKGRHTLRTALQMKELVDSE
jgi:nitrite reductase/ring-hydroxylating ferredoxin subunit